MNQVYVSIGTNIGERAQNLQQAVRLLMAQEHIVVKQVSSIYETAAVGYTEQADFLNIAVHVETSLSAEAMLTVCQQIENELGRVREFRWGPRIIDLDILLYNHENIQTEHLIVPHPRMYERAFALVPLKDIAIDRDTMLEKALHKLETIDAQEEGVKQWKKIYTVDEFVHFES
ncbi:MAG: 2-amino-4-hydroxy-6-hydroxymethyldihydropteridine diphosphokinase [Solibacillus sp.]